MGWFREQGKSDHEVMEALKAKFGDNYRITSRRTVKFGGIWGVGRRTGVEYRGYILGKATLPLSNRRKIQTGNEKNNKHHRDTSQITTYGKKRYSEREDFPISERDLAERDQQSRTEILKRFGKNKEVQRLLRNNKEVQHLLHNEKLVADVEQETTLPPVPHLKSNDPPSPSSAAPPGEKSTSTYEESQSPPKEIAKVAQNGAPYSSDAVSAYQRDIDHREANVLERLEKLEHKLNRRSKTSETAGLNKLREGMYHNEFPPLFVDRLVSQIKRELPQEELEKLEVLWEYVLLHIAENMSFMAQKSHERVVVLVGPTGVGKTTTIAKIAARESVAKLGGQKKVHLITLDNYRIGAQNQIRTYGEIMEARVDCVETTEGLASCIAEDKESEMILIDTMGRSPRDHMKLAEMRQFIEYCGHCEIHLTLSATSGASAMKEIITQFKPFGLRSVILTKLDELGRIGSTLATFLQEDISLSYVTTGQTVPHDIQPASALILLQQLRAVQIDWQSFAQKL